MSESERMSVYTVSNLDKIEAVVVISISFWRYAYIQCDQVSAVSDWTAVGGAFWRRLLFVDVLGGGVYADVCARVTSSCTSDTNKLDLNTCFVYNEKGVLSYEACRMF